MKIALVFLVCFTSCATMKGTSKIRFNYNNGTQKQHVIMNIPKGSKMIKITAGGEGEERRYLYADSSVIYLSTLTGSATLNESLISRRQDNYNKKFMSDTASFVGIDAKGNYWKEIKRGKLLYGYSNISITQKSVFEAAISSLR